MTRDSLNFLERKDLKEELAILGVLVDIGKDGSGTAGSPGYFRKLGIVDILESLGTKVNDLGDVSCPSHAKAEIGDKKVKYLNDICLAAEHTAEKIAGVLKNKSRVITLGGDHATSLGTISGAHAVFGDDLGLIWIDAHSDINTFKTTPTGNIHGQVSAATLGMGHPRLTSIFKKGAKIKKENILYIGLKDIDQEEVDVLREKKLACVTSFDILRRGLFSAEKAIDQLRSRVKNIWISFDVDVIDEEYLPATLMPNSSGLDKREIKALAKYIGKTCPVRGIDVVEFAPQKDINKKSGQLVMEIIAGFLGSEYGDYTKYLGKYKKMSEKSFS
ncbi:MAG: arginase [bacterium]|nr:arginase [bacterium]